MGLIPRKEQRQLNRERQQIQKARRTQLEHAAPNMVKEIEDLKALAIKLGNEKATLLAACKKLENVLSCLMEEGRITFNNDAPFIQGELEEAQSAIEQAGESGK